MSHINTLPEDGIYAVSLLNNDQRDDLAMIVMEIEDSRYGILEETALRIDQLTDRYVILALIITCIQEQDDDRYKRAGRHAANRLYSLFHS